MWPRLFAGVDSYEHKTDSTLCSARLQKLGWTYRPLEETLVDAVESYRENGLLKA